MPTGASSNLICALLRGFFLIPVAKEDNLLTIALLAGVLTQVRAYVARSLKLLRFVTSSLNQRESEGIPFSQNIPYNITPTNNLFYFVLRLHCYFPCDAEIIIIIIIIMVIFKCYFSAELIALS